MTSRDREALAAALWQWRAKLIARGMVQMLSSEHHLLTTRHANEVSR
jgi:hypothetical protein